MKVKVTESQLAIYIGEVIDERDGLPGGIITESLDKSDEAKIKTLVKKELKDIIGSPNAQQFETTISKMVKDKIKGDKQIEDHLVKITRNVLIQLYKTLWMKRNFWSDGLNANGN